MVGETFPSVMMDTAEKALAKLRFSTALEDLALAGVPQMERVRRALAILTEEQREYIIREWYRLEMEEP